MTKKLWKYSDNSGDSSAYKWNIRRIGESNEVYKRTRLDKKIQKVPLTVSKDEAWKNNLKKKTNILFMSITVSHTRTNNKAKFKAPISATPYFRHLQRVDIAITKIPLTVVSAYMRRKSDRVCGREDANRQHFRADHCLERRLCGTIPLQIRVWSFSPNFSN